MQKVKAPKACYFKLIKGGDTDKGGRTKAGLDLQGMSLTRKVMKTVLRRFPEGEGRGVQCEQFREDEKLTNQPYRFLAREAAVAFAKETPPRIKPIEKHGQRAIVSIRGGNGVSADGRKEVDPVAIFK